MSLIKVLFDTNVLTYAHDEFFDFHIPSASLVEMVFQGKIQGIVTEQNMMELYRLLTNQTVMRGKALQPAKAKELISDTYLCELNLRYPRNSLSLTTLNGGC
jgi:predicted nucleic acid-binding protein